MKLIGARSTRSSNSDDSDLLEYGRVIKRAGQAGSGWQPVHRKKAAEDFEYGRVIKKRDQQERRRLAGDPSTGSLANNHNKRDFELGRVIKRDFELGRVIKRPAAAYPNFKNRGDSKRDFEYGRVI